MTRMMKAPKSVRTAEEFGRIRLSQSFFMRENEAERGRHIWDQRSADGGMGAMATVVVPWLVDQLGAGTSWRAMGWWIYDNLPYSELQFFPKPGGPGSRDHHPRTSR